MSNPRYRNQAPTQQVKTVKRSTFITYLVISIIIMVILAILAIVFFIQYNRTLANLQNNICPVCG